MASKSNIDYNEAKTRYGRELSVETMLEVKNLEKYYGSKSNLTKAIDQISFQVNQGEFVGIMGASGSRENYAIELYFND